MKRVLQLEEWAQLIAGLFFIWYQPISISAWIWPLLFLSPDISMLGYLAGPRVGAFTYNLFHHKGLAIAVALIGFYFQLPWLQLAGIILWSHSCFDRVFGYGLKYETGFQHTHLGNIGSKRN